MSCYDQMSEILREGHALSTDPTFPRAYEASILNPLHYKFLATPLRFPHTVTRHWKSWQTNKYSLVDRSVFKC